MGERGDGRGTLRSARTWMVLLAAACLAIPATAVAAFPGTDPTESPRINTPNDPGFDECEADDEQGPPTCGSYFNEEFRAFGFSPDSADQVPDPTNNLPHYVTGTRYADCSQLDADGKAANRAAEAADTGVNPVAQTLAECLQIGGVRADQAFKYWPGDAGTSVAILDTGIRWQEADLRLKVRLNRDELPMPLWDRAANPLEGAACGGAAPNPGAYDANNDNAFNVLDYRCDSRVSLAGGDTESDSILDASDLIARFSGDGDGDANGFVDDIAGWDFFDDDNDPFDASSCCSADGHGSGRGRDAVADTNNALDGIGMCPRCQIMPLRVWD